MRADQIMSREVIIVSPETSITDAASLMLSHHISGLPVVDKSGKLAGIVSEGDFLRRSELGTQTKRGFLRALIAGPGKEAEEFTRQTGRKIIDIMTPEPITVTEDTLLEEVVRLMEKHDIKRLPVVRNDRLIGLVTRSDLLRTLAGIVYPSAGSCEDANIRDKIIHEIKNATWSPVSLKIMVHDGIAHIQGIITDERSRQATIVAAENVPGVKQVHDHLCWVDPISGLSVLSPEDEATQEKTA
ncbi:MAG: CBS domain-containing protein [Xanthobacteraceae bacterium]|nr:CBS domain-containing protein [Xanthobacteraceae bacterium]